MSPKKAAGHDGDQSGKEFKDRIDMIADISKSGKLLEMGYDPFTRAPESKVAATQTEGSGTKLVVQQDINQSNKALEVILSNKEIVRSSNSSSSQVLRLVVGMLGLEVHAQPSSWAESWLTFQDHTFASLGLGSKKMVRRKHSSSSCLEETPAEWQMNVLDRLREHVQRGRDAVAVTEGSQEGEPSQGHDWGPDFHEHLELAEFALRRITSAVNVLQDPETQDRPILLREYTEEMLVKVSQDLRKWLEQLGTLLSLYHVHLLDLEGERRKLAHQLRELQAKFDSGEEERRAAVRKQEVLSEMWEEEKMKRNAERLLGITLAGDEAKIYSQSELDEFYRLWEQEHLGPLLQEISEMRIQNQEAREKLKGQITRERSVVPTGRGRGGVDDASSAGDLTLSKNNVSLLVGCLNAVNERTFDKTLNKSITALTEDLPKGGNNLAAILAGINMIPIMDEKALQQMMMDRFGGGKVEKKVVSTPTKIDLSSVSKLLDMVAKEFDELEAGLQKVPPSAGADNFRALAVWVRSSVSNASSAVKNSNQSGLQLKPPPKWDLGFLSKGKPSTKNALVNTTDELLKGLMRGGPDNTSDQVKADYEARMRALRNELEAKIKAAWEVAERERMNAQEALERLAAESAKADATLAELRRKIKMLEALLREKGLGKQTEDAMYGAGLSEFLQGRDVFERLYRDALDRMRRHAEAQARFFEETSMDFLRTIGTIMDPRLKLPGLDTSILAADSDVTFGSVRRVDGPTPIRSSSLARSQSRSPPGSPATRDSYASAVLSPRRRLADKGADLLSISRLSAPSGSPSQPVGKAIGERPATDTSKRQSGHLLRGPPRANTALAFSGTERPDSALVIGFGGNSSPTMHEAKKHSSPIFIAQAATKNGQSVQVRSHGHGKTLPPLECKGQGQGPGQSGARSRSFSNDEVEARRGRVHVVPFGSPMRETKPDKDLELRLLGKDPVLSIRASAPPSGLLPPHLNVEQRAPSAANPGSRPPSTQAGIHRTLSRQGGAVSMPHLGPPRLLVQTLQGVATAH